MKKVTAAVIIENGKLLLTRRSQNCAVPGAWELPGGKLEEGETLQECLMRELQEELQMKGAAGEILASTEYIYAHGSFEIFAIKFLRNSNFCLNPEIHDEYTWATSAELSKLCLAPADVELINKLVIL